MKRAVIVTGGAGFIGRNLVAALNGRGEGNICIVDRLGRGGKWHNPTGFPFGWGCVWNAARGLGFGLRWDERVFPYAWSWAAGHGHPAYPTRGQCHTVTLQPSTSPLLPFDQLVATNQVQWVNGHDAIETGMAAGFTSARDQVPDLKP